MIRLSFKEQIRSTDLGLYCISEYHRYRGAYEINKYNDYEFICRLYKKQFGIDINLVSPKRYTEKLQWLKLFYRNDLMPIVSDKYEVRAYLKSIGFDYLLNDLIAVYENVDDIDIKSLPSQFVIKASHGSGWNLIVKDKNSINWFWWKKIMRSWLKQNLYWFGREWNYKDQKPRIIVEKYLEDDSGELRDYKIICMNGEPEFMQIDQNRFSNHKRLYVDVEGKPLCFGDNQDNNDLPNIAFGEVHRKMIRIAKELCNPFPMVRVDFYECNGKIIFGELTFFGGSGFFKFDPDSMDEKLGAKIQLPEPNHNLELLERLKRESKDIINED